MALTDTVEEVEGTLADFTDASLEDLAVMLRERKRGFTIHTTEQTDDEEPYCCHPDHDQHRGFRGWTMREAMIAALIDADPEAGV